MRALFSVFPLFFAGYFRGLLAAYLLGAAMPGWAQHSADARLPVLQLNAPDGQIELAEHSQYWIDTTGTAVVEQVEAWEYDLPFARRPAGHTALLDGQVMWIRFNAMQLDLSQRWALEVSSAGVDAVSLHYRDAIGNWVEQKAGDSIPVSRWPRPDRFPVFELDTEQTRPVTYFIRIEHARTPFSAPLFIYSHPALLAQRMQEQFLLGAYFGLTVLMALVAAAYAVAFRDRSFASYAVYIAALAAAQAGLLGIGGQYLWPDFAGWNNLSSFLLPVLAACSGIWFARVVTRPRQFSAVLDWLSMKLMVALALLAVVDVFLPTRASFLAVTLLIVVAMAVVCVMVFIAWQRGDVTMRWIALGFVPVILTAPFPILRNLGLIPISFLTQYGLTLGAALETPLLFYGLLRRAAQRREARARAAALTQTEPLTGLTNLHTFEERLHDALLRSNRYKHLSALLLVDLSNHGWFAKEHGRQIADYALVLTGSCLRKLARDIDIAARVGDSEFALLIEGPVTAAQAVAAATQLVARALQPSDLLPVGSHLKLHVAIALVPDATCTSQHLDASEHLHYLLASLREMPANTRKSIKTVNF
ncbi:diguanylate cyclase (GGDEF) domain-containing protein [Polaromonas sp. YR568]|uniref:7TM diverse intracellular signaling domain-containing protein n=1 Tax=Polaromonas sp. YR568 TaxID=1855301 RepID=UPI0008E55C12|nr:7TM diverse intracellular signaling domain-containing protein [Polaromonas sp. YR568]SFU96849.1 diguanylate cyclase (GGDEF) domain-containing protein [Polaromonas sp. YR568]